MTRDLRDIPRSWWGKCAVAGLIGGLVMIGFLMISFSAQGRGLWTPLNAIGATLPMFRPPSTLGTISTAFGGATVTGFLIHMTMSVLWALAYGVIMAAFVPHHIRSLKWQSLYALGWGSFLWVFSGLRLFTQALAPVMVLVLSPTWEFYVAHLLYALTTAWTIAGLTRRRDFTVVFAREEAPVLTQRR